MKEGGYLLYSTRTFNRQENEDNMRWMLASFHGLPLGWMKLLPNRINNYFPNEWRIRKNAAELAEQQGGISLFDHCLQQAADT